MEKKFKKLHVNSNDNTIIDIKSKISAEYFEITYILRVWCSYTENL